MPCLRGLEVSLYAQLTGERIPEFPHPEGASVKLVNGIQGNGADESSPVRDSECSSPRYTKTKPVVSVYVPSVPGSTFSVEYTVNKIPELSGPGPQELCKYIYFKLFINGRHMTDWGIDPTVIHQGRVDKSLWAPSGRYSEYVGVEGRHFVFLPGQENKSVAEDGGLIEVRAFRAANRAPRSLGLEEFRNQENYGIATPSIGLVDEPQDVIKYHWHLHDPVDSPYAVFRLHYRSWRCLRHLNLIPSMYSERSQPLPGSPSHWSTAAQPNSHSRSHIPNPRGSYQLTSGDDDSVFDGDTFQDASAATSGPQSVEYFLKSPPERFNVFSKASGIPQPSKTVRDTFRESYLQRPLPELPMEDPAPFGRRASVASARSAASATPSLTPSLIQYVDDGSFEGDDIEIGVAHAVQMPAAVIDSTELEESEKVKVDESVDCSGSDYEISPPSTKISASPQENPSPSQYLPTTGSMLEAEYSMVLPKHGSAISRNQEPVIGNPSTSLYRGKHRPQLTTPIQLSESEWMSRTPSPAHAVMARG
ncbi:hypothetical protein QBC34DRAFT_396268 [Podospora aff. communis PSN243]|uniref:Arrestin-like N-terminal domain-containing protein n=1 Tax=Podospora aff. communis PSN243 TaxID=3040156 RepID=A0AAV9H2I4_9PEZI|nr:hypothetical protein QBC34DRAFT_396268 [Podospora aff. communis PSN243]